MAEEVQYSSESATNKRKYDENSPSPGGGARRPTGFSAAPVSSQSPPPASYNSVPPPMEEVQLAKQKAQDIAARHAEVKRPRVDNGDSNQACADPGELKCGGEDEVRPILRSPGFLEMINKVDGKMPLPLCEVMLCQGYGPPEARDWNDSEWLTFVDGMELDEKEELLALLFPPDLLLESDESDEEYRIYDY